MAVQANPSACCCCTHSNDNDLSASLHTLCQVLQTRQRTGNRQEVLFLLSFVTPFEVSVWYTDVFLPLWMGQSLSKNVECPCMFGMVCFAAVHAVQLLLYFLPAKVFVTMRDHE